ncbi:MAG: hypothetical protein HQK53_03900 [Oligoflexia bacterium]|nr:hypothetical protein [Oligoflexia bacterium]
MKRNLLALLIVTLFTISCSQMPKNNTASETALPIVENPSEFIHQLYLDKSGHGLENTDVSTLEKMNYAQKNVIYGEITYNGAITLFEKLNIKGNDVFYDIGSGVGKLVLQAYLTTPAKKSVGIELVGSRAKKAETVYQQLMNQGILSKAGNKELKYVEADVITSDLSDATTIFWANLTWEEGVIDKVVQKLSSSVKHPLLIVSHKSLDNYPNMKLKEAFTVECTWTSRSNVYLYEMEYPVSSKNTAINTSTATDNI